MDVGPAMFGDCLMKIKETELNRVGLKICFGSDKNNQDLQCVYKRDSAGRAVWGQS